MKSTNAVRIVNNQEKLAGGCNSHQNRKISCFTYENIGEAYQYLSSMNDSITDDFFQKMRDFAVEEIQNTIYKESEDWREKLDNDIIKKTDGEIVRNYRAGVRKVNLWIPLFIKIPVFLPKFRHKQFNSDLLNNLFSKSDSFIVALIYSLYVSGISYRKISNILKFLNYNISATGVSNKLKLLKDEMENYWQRRLDNKDYRYLIADGLWIKEKRSIRGKHVLLSAVGITSDGKREIIGKRICDSESANCWKQLFLDLQYRGLNMDNIKLIVADKGKGLRGYFSNNYRDKPVVRCGFHFGNNLFKNIKNITIRKEMYSDLFWILGTKDVDPNRNKVAKTFKLKVEVIYDKWTSMGYIRESNKLINEIDEVLISYYHEKDIFKASKLITSNTIERYFRDYRQFSYGKGSLLDENSINYLTNLVFYDINQRLKRRPSLWELKKIANKT